MIYNVLKGLGVFVSVIIIVPLLLYFVDAEFDSPSGDNSQAGLTEVSRTNNGGFFDRLNTMPDSDELGRIKSLAGIDNIMYLFYSVILVISFLIIKLFRQTENNYKIVVFGLYTGFAMMLLLNLFLWMNFPSWNYKYAFGLFLNGVGTGLLASLISVSLYSLKNLLVVLKDEGITVYELIVDKVRTPGVNMSLSMARSWVLFAVLVSGLLIANIAVS